MGNGRVVRAGVIYTKAYYQSSYEGVYNHVEKQADPGTSSCSRVGRQLGRGLKQLVPGSVPFWALSSCEAKEWV